jgi:peptidase M23-like protein
MLLRMMLMVFALLLVPAYLVYTLWRGQSRSKFAWLVKLLSNGAYLLFIVLIGNWAWLSHYLRHAWSALFLVAAVASYRRVRALPFHAQGGRAAWRGQRGALLELVVACALLAYTGSGYLHGDAPVRLALPLRHGRYYVGQGGNSFLLNHHHRNRAQRYAVDVVALNGIGARASGIHPSELERYVIFGETVYSPCGGSVAAVADGLPDLLPPESDSEHPAGNHVVVTCEAVRVVLAHLQQGSVSVRVGEEVLAGQPIGRVGNSGNTSEPHLHVHAVRAGTDVLTGEGVPLLFEGIFPVRNTLFTRD